MAGRAASVASPFYSLLPGLSRTKLKLDQAEKSQYSFKVLNSSKEVPPLIGRFVFISSAWDPDPLDPQHFNFLEPDSQNYADPRFKINQCQQKKSNNFQKTKKFLL